MKEIKLTPRTLALYATRRGVSFACFIHPSMVTEWGSKHIVSNENEKNAATLRLAKELIDRIRPDVLVIENVEDGYSRRAPRMKPLYRAIARYGEKREIPMHMYSRRELVDVFSAVGASVKHEFNAAIATLIPTLLRWQPKKRTLTDSEVPAQGIFDAASLGLTFFVREKRLDIAQAMQDAKTVE